MQNQQAVDILLRSSDNKLFHSCKIFLSMTSPVFNDMFTLPQPKLDSPDNIDEPRHHGLPVIDLEEDSCTLDHILSLCHPPSCTGKHFKVNNARELRAVLEAATKYDMETVRCVALEELSKPSILCEDPVRVYALACQYECHKAARLAAKYTLALPSLVRGYVSDLEKIHAGKLYHLLSYREACVAAACSLAVDHEWIVHTGSLVPLFGCIGGGSDGDLEWTTVRNLPSRKYPSGREECKSAHKWWFEYMKRSECVLQRWPDANAVKDQKLVNDALAAISASKCRECKASQVSEAFRSFVNTFAENIEHRVAEVEIKLEF